MGFSDNMFQRLTRGLPLHSGLTNMEPNWRLCWALVAYLSTLRSVTSSTFDYQQTQAPQLTTFNVKAHLDSSATLRCQLVTGAHNRGWYLLKWFRLEPDGAVTPLIQLPAASKVPEYGSNIPGTLQPRLQPVITIQQNMVEFNLLINNATCSDEGDYRCSAITGQGEILSGAELRVYATPQTPEVTYQQMSPPMETKMIATCRADVGLPPKMLIWYMRRPESAYFTIVDNQPDEMQETDGCHTETTRTVNIPVTPDNQGTRYKCGYRGYIEKEGMFRELVVHSQVQEMETLRSDRRTPAVCREPNCQVQDLSPDHSPESRPSNRNLSEAKRVDHIVIFSATFISLIFHRSHIVHL